MCISAARRLILCSLFFTTAICILGTPVFAEEKSPKSFTQIVPKDLRQIEALHREAEGLITENDFRGAIKIYSDILLIEPDDEAAYTNMGHTYMILGDFGRAEEAFINALHINPENETAILGLERISDPDRPLETPEEEASGAAIG